MPTKFKRMFQLQKTISLEEILEKDFVCNLSSACCVDEAGVPKEETQILADIYPKVKPFLRKEGIAAIEAQGTHVIGNGW